MTPREPMAVLSQPEPPKRRGWDTSQPDPVRRGLIALAVILVVGWVVGAGIYRQQHCVQIFGHWFSVERTTIPLFCQ